MVLLNVYNAYYIKYYVVDPNAIKETKLSVKKVKKLEKLSSESHELSAEDATMFRAVSARANYLAQDRPDIAFACKELCRDFSCPTRDSYCKLKKAWSISVGEAQASVRFWLAIPTNQNGHLRRHRLRGL